MNDGDKKTPRTRLRVIPGQAPAPADHTAGEPSALSAKWPDVVGELEDDARDARVRTGIDTVLLDDPQAPEQRRGFIRVVMRVPLDREEGQVYGVFVEVDRDGYVALQTAFKTKTPTRVWGRLANRLPYLAEAFGSEVCILEDGSDHLARVVEARHPLILNGPQVGPWDRTSDTSSGA